MLQNFLQQDVHLPQNLPQPFAMEQMRRDLDGFRTTSPTVHSPGWAAEFDPAEHVRMEVAFKPPKLDGVIPTGFSAAEFHKFQQMERIGSPRVSSLASQNPYGMSLYQSNNVGMGIGQLPFTGGPQFSMQRHYSDRQTQEKGKGRMTELDDKNWEQQFAEIDAAGQQELDDEAQEDIERRLDEMDRSVLSETNEFGDFESVWRGIQAETAAARGDEEYMLGQMNDGISLNPDAWGTGNWDSFDSAFHEGYRDPQLGNYLFEEENPFAATKDPFDEGIKIMNEGGNLSLAALAFEAAVQRDPQHVEAWCQLGNAQAQNEKESPAIRALEQTIKLDPSNLSALMGLAISYTNEGYDSTAYRTLERWLSTKYPQVVSPENLTPEGTVGYTDRHILHQKVTDLFIQAAQLSPDGEHMDPDVQVGLGVLFYGAEEYDKACDCFEAALASAESGTTNEVKQAHLLWNRLGATLANSGRSEEAIAAYEKAITINPNFVRARYNLGVSCINIGVMAEAAQHLLKALSMHRVFEREGMQRVKEVIGEDTASSTICDDDIERMAGMNQSTNLLDTLRRVFTNMRRRDLSEKVVYGMDIEQFRGDFDF